MDSKQSGNFYLNYRFQQYQSLVAHYESIYLRNRTFSPSWPTQENEVLTPQFAPAAADAHNNDEENRNAVNPEQHANPVAENFNIPAPQNNAAAAVAAEGAVNADDGENFEAREQDIVDILYMFMKVLLVLMLLYFYASASRITLIIVVFFFLQWVRNRWLHRNPANNADNNNNWQIVDEGAVETEDTDEDNNGADPNAQVRAEQNAERRSWFQQYAEQGWVFIIGFFQTFFPEPANG